MKNFFRIQSIELTNFKNIKHGQVDFSNYGNINMKAERNITAVYGQNGSGKTALVDAIAIIKNIMQGGKIPSEFVNYMRKGTPSTTINVTFFIKSNEDTCLATYSITFSRDNNGVIVSNEVISAKEYRDNNWNYKTDIINYTNEPDGFIISPNYLYNELTNSRESTLDLLVAQSLCTVENDKTKTIDSCSLLFSNRFRELLKKDKEKTSLLHLSKIITLIANSVEKNVLIISDSTFGGISENLHAIPIYIRQKYSDLKGQEVEAIGSIPIEIYDKTRVPVKLFDLYSNFVNQINAVLPSIIPGISVELIDKQEEFDSQKLPMISFSIVTVRNGEKISLKYESAGIKKILCVISSLIAAFNNEDMCFVVDELDSGIFEYLLGQIITVFKEDAKGQLIFTSHNLHVLELLDNKSIIITTWNSENCYQHLKDVQTNNNKRLLYLRQIELSDDECDVVYNKTNQYEMSYAFKKAYQIAKEGAHN